MSRKKDMPTLRSRIATVEKYKATHPHMINTKMGAEPTPENVAMSEFGEYRCVPLKEYGKRAWFFLDSAAAAHFKKTYRGAVI